MYEVELTNTVLKNIKKLPKNIEDKLFYLIGDLEENGPIQPNWKNYSKLENNKYHCHLSRKWVACWKHESNTLTIEIYYAGSREKTL